MEEFKPKEEGTKEKSPPSHQYNPNSSAGFQNKSEKRSIRAMHNMAIITIYGFPQMMPIK